MKKLLLMGTAVLAASATFAMEPKEFADLQILTVSPDGSFSVSAYMGTLTVIDNETGGTTVFPGDEMVPYELGQGNQISTDGTIVGSCGNYPGYIRDGKWHNLKTPFPQNSNTANGISADGTRICGNIGTSPLSTDDAPVPMQSPAVWDLQPDGTFSDPIMLPYPKTDYTNRTPQYVTAISISDDGKKIAGLVTDNSGFMITLIWYSLNENNEWVMHNEFEKLANPDNIPIPEFPGECPPAPVKEDFMTPEEIEAYNAALKEWEEAGTWDYTTYPNIDDYISPDGLAAFGDANSKWNTEVFIPWQEAYDRFEAAIASCGGTGLLFNQALMSRDGSKAIACTVAEHQVPDSFYPVSVYSTAEFNLGNGSHKIYEGGNFIPSSISADGTIFVYSENSMPRQTWVYLPGQTTSPVSLMDYVKERDKDTYDWMAGHMVHDFESLDPDTWEPVMVKDFAFTGSSYCSSSAGVIACMTENLWDYSSYMYSYIIPVRRPDSVERTGEDTTLDIMVFKGGMIVIEGMATAVNIYDMEGREVFASDKAGGTIMTGLSDGIYVIKVTSPYGVRTRKAVF